MSKKNRRALRRTLLAISMMLVVAFAAVSGTIAWLTSVPTQVENTFTVGQVKIELDETDTDSTNTNPYTTGAHHTGRDLENDYHLVPGATETKDPIVWVNKNSDKAYIFLKVNNGLAGAEAANAAQDDSNTTDVDETKLTIESQILANGWTKYDAGSTVANETVYYRVFDPENLGGLTLESDLEYKIPTFANIHISESLTNEQLSSYNDKKITVKAYAIQFEEMADYADAWNKVKDAQ